MNNIRTTEQTIRNRGKHRTILRSRPATSLALHLKKPKRHVCVRMAGGRSLVETPAQGVWHSVHLLDNGD